MQVKIRFFGQARHLAANETVQVEIATGSSVNDAVKSALADAPEKLRSLLLADTGRLRASVLAAVNGAAADPAAAGRLSENDEIVLHTALAGG